MVFQSLAKGKAGEREFAEFLRERGLTARRSQQYMGTADSSDVICTELMDVHFEVKRTERGNPYLWLAQAIRDAGESKVPIVAHRRNREDWIAVLSMDVLVALLKSRGHEVARSVDAMLAAEAPASSDKPSA